MTKKRSTFAPIKEILVAFFLNPVLSDANGTPTAMRAGTSIALIYRKILSATDVTYTVEESADLVSWALAQTTDQVLAQKNGIQTIQSSVAMGTNNKFFLRLKIARP